MIETECMASSVTRLGDLLHFGKLFKACCNNYFTHIFRQFLLSCQNLSFCQWNHFWATFRDFWRLFTGHTDGVGQKIKSYFLRFKRAKKKWNDWPEKCVPYKYKSCAKKEKGKRGIDLQRALCTEKLSEEIQCDEIIWSTFGHLQQWNFAQ